MRIVVNKQKEIKKLFPCLTLAIEREENSPLVLLLFLFILHY